MSDHLGDRAVRSQATRVVERGAVSAAAVVVIGALIFGSASVTTSESVRWITGIVLAVLVVSAWVLCAHAGGHAWFVPLPALILAVLWFITVSGHGDAASWWLVALTAATAGAGLLIGGTALRQQLRRPLLDKAPLAGAIGTAMTPLGPDGIVRVAGETWSANSLSGPLEAGVEVHVVRLNGVRLDVWSEVGTVPDHTALETEKEQS